MTIEDKLDRILDHARAHGELLCEIALSLGVGRENKALAEATEKLKQHTAVLEAAITAQKV